MIHVFEIIGGLSLFLFGITYLSEGLKKISSQNIKNFLAKVTSSPISGTLIGLAVTSLIQSSSATTVLTVGFVNAGLMNFSQAIGIVYGANIGTTVTGQLIAFKLDSFSLPILAFGIILHAFGKSEKLKDLGAFFAGFGMIFYGMLLMKTGITPFKESQAVRDIFVNFSKTPVLGVMAGMVITMIIQSSSVTVGLVLTLIGAGLLDIYGAIPLILGDNIGTCITAAIASIGRNISAKRVAAAHFGFNIIGTIIVLILLPLYIKLILITSSNPVRQAANAHSLFNIMNTILFLPMTRYYIRLIEFVIRGKEVTKPDRAIYLDVNLIGNPLVAMEAVTKEISRALSYSDESLVRVKDFLVNNQTKQLKTIEENEQILDNIQYDITNYVAKLSGLDLTDHEASLVPRLLHATNDMERIGDLGQNLYNIIKRQMSNRISFSENHLNELDTMIEVVREYCQYVSNTLNGGEHIDMNHARTFEKKVNELRDSYKIKYFEILKDYYDKPYLGTIYYDYILNLEKMGDHLTNISEAFDYTRTA